MIFKAICAKFGRPKIDLRETHKQNLAQRETADVLQTSSLEGTLKIYFLEHYYSISKMKYVYFLPSLNFKAGGKRV